MKKNTKVNWILKNGDVGNGTVIADEDNTGHVPVAVHGDGEVHQLIWCAVTWLKAVEEPAPKTGENLQAPQEPARDHVEP